MERMIELIGEQAKELLKNELVVERLEQFQTEEEKQQWLAIAAMYALAKANK